MSAEIHILGTAHSKGAANEEVAEVAQDRRAAPLDPNPKTILFEPILASADQTVLRNALQFGRKGADTHLMPDDLEFLAPWGLSWSHFRRVRCETTSGCSLIISW
jgi:hypothetical protein